MVLAVLFIIRVWTTEPFPNQLEADFGICILYPTKRSSRKYVCNVGEVKVYEHCVA